jgi:hypothetical protein
MLWLPLQMQRLTLIAQWCALVMSMSTVVPEIDFQPTSSRFRSDFIHAILKLEEGQAEKKSYI